MHTDSRADLEGSLLTIYGLLVPLYDCTKLRLEIVTRCDHLIGFLRLMGLPTLPKAELGIVTVPVGVVEIAHEVLETVIKLVFEMLAFLLDTFLAKGVELLLLSLKILELDIFLSALFFVDFDLCALILEVFACQPLCIFRLLRGFLELSEVVHDFVKRPFIFGVACHNHLLQRRVLDHGRRRFIKSEALHLGGKAL